MLQGVRRHNTIANHIALSIPDTKMENPGLEQFIPSLAHSLKPGYPEFSSRLNFSECRKEIDSLLNDWYDVQTAFKRPIVKMLASELPQANQPRLSEQSRPRRGSKNP